MESYFTISQSFFELISIFWNNSGVGLKHARWGSFVLISTRYREHPREVSQLLVFVAFACQQLEHAISWLVIVSKFCSNNVNSVKKVCVFKPLLRNNCGLRRCGRAHKAGAVVMAVALNSWDFLSTELWVNSQPRTSRAMSTVSVKCHQCMSWLSAICFYMYLYETMNLSAHSISLFDNYFLHASSCTFI